MRTIALCFILLTPVFCPQAEAYDPQHSQRVKYHQSRAKWKIKEGKERMKKSRAASQSARNHSYNSSHSRSSSSTSSRSRSRSSSANSAADLAGAKSSLTSFISVANRATRLEHLYPYAMKKKVEYWKRLSAKDKQKELLRIKKWTYHARITGAESQPYVSTVKISGTKKGVHLWKENGAWKYSDVF